MADDATVEPDEQPKLEAPDNEGGDAPLEKGGEGAEPEDEGREVEPEGEPEPPKLRRSAASYIIERKDRKIARLESKRQEEADEEEDTDDDKDDDKIAKSVRKGLEPVIQAFASREDENELKDLFSSHAEAKKLSSADRKHFEGRIRELWKTPAYQSLPAEFIFNGLWAQKAQTGRKKNAADLEARQNKGGGSGRRPQAVESDFPTAEEIEEMDDKEFTKLRERMKRGAFVE